MSTTFIEIYNDLITRRQTIPLTPLRWFSDVISANINDLYLNGENEKKVSVEMIILLYILNDDLAAARDLVIAHLLADNDEARERRKTSTVWYLHYVLQRRLKQSFDTKSILDKIPSTNPILIEIFDADPLNAQRFAEKVERPGGKAQRAMMEDTQMREIQMLKEILCSS